MIDSVEHCMLMSGTGHIHIRHLSTTRGGGVIQVDIYFIMVKTFMLPPLECTENIHSPPLNVCMDDFHAHFVDMHI